MLFEEAPEYILKVADFRNFTTVKDVQAWLGLSGFYRGYLKNYAQRTVAVRRCLEFLPSFCKLRTVAVHVNTVCMTMKRLEVGLVLCDHCAVCVTSN